MIPTGVSLAVSADWHTRISLEILYGVSQTFSARISPGIAPVGFPAGIARRIPAKLLGRSYQKFPNSSILRAILARIHKRVSW